MTMGLSSFNSACTPCGAIYRSSSPLLAFKERKGRARLDTLFDRESGFKEKMFERKHMQSTIDVYCENEIGSVSPAEAMMVINEETGGVRGCWRKGTIEQAQVARGVTLCCLYCFFSLPPASRRSL